MADLGLIGGTGLTKLDSLVVERQKIVMTPYGEPSAPLTFGSFEGHTIVFIPRHGAGHSIPPHEVNYRANIWALHHVGVKKVISIASVGGITQPPGALCIPDQIIDYTWGREHTYVESNNEKVTHIDFTEPYCEALRKKLIESARGISLPVVTRATYGATQGPRLETAREIRRMEQDGCDLVGMTGMPEASLAREIGLCYASCSVVVNWAAGKSDKPITMSEIESNLKSSIQHVRMLIGALS